MEIIRLPGYTEDEKLNIAKKFLVTKQRQANGLGEANVEFSDNALLTVIRRYTRESGVRNLEREIASVCRKVAKAVVRLGNETHLKMGATSIPGYLGVPKFRYGRTEEKDEVGLATGLAWTEVGGELLQIEVVIMPGKGKLTITGKLGDVMQESAQAAVSYVRSRAARLGIDTEFYKNVDIHIHVPEGAIPKDGPSAGITIATAIVSALLKRPVRRDLAMTGEITLRGRVLPIGGLKEKILAAHRGQVKTVIIPEENRKDVKEIPPRIQRALELVLVEHMDQVLQRAVILNEGENLFCEPQPSFDYVQPAVEEGAVVSH
jgi:ATP-dependent Lon protease